MKLSIACILFSMFVANGALSTAEARQVCTPLTNLEKEPIFNFLSHTIQSLHVVGRPVEAPLTNLEKESIFNLLKLGIQSFHVVGPPEEGPLLSKVWIALNKQGICNYELGKYPVAIQYYDEVLAVRPNNIVALNNKGLALSGLGNYTGAIKYYDKALALNPNYVEGLNNKGLALYGLGTILEL